MLPRNHYLIRRLMNILDILDLYDFPPLHETERMYRRSLFYTKSESNHR